MEIRSFDPSDEAAVVELWTECGLVVPWNSPHRDIERKLTVQSKMFLVGCSGGQMIASFMDSVQTSHTRPCGRTKERGSSCSQPERPSTCLPASGRYRGCAFFPQ